MRDNELRGVILQKYYDKRRDGFFQWTAEDFKDVPNTIKFDAVDLFRVCDQLGEHGLIEWQGLQDGKGQTIGGWGKISAFGVGVIEGNAKSPVSITLDQVQDFSVQIDKIVHAIEQSKASEHEKIEAKFLLKKFLEHPLVTSILGRLASRIKL
jgi:hypothetical protein